MHGYEASIQSRCHSSLLVSGTGILIEIAFSPLGLALIRELSNEFLYWRRRNVTAVSKLSL